ncbi:MAG: hypothetical protein ACRYGG_06715, partial [Janthinobacterium lividum]
VGEKTQAVVLQELQAEAVVLQGLQAVATLQVAKLEQEVATLMQVALIQEEVGLRFQKGC